MNPDTSGTDTSGTDTSGTDTSGTDTSGTDTTATDTTGTGAGAPVTITEIAEFLRQLRTLSRSSTAADTRDTTVERAAFLARKADLFARIAAHHPDLIPTPTSIDGGRA